MNPALEPARPCVPPSRPVRSTIAGSQDRAKERQRQVRNLKLIKFKLGARVAQASSLCSMKATAFVKMVVTCHRGNPNVNPGTGALWGGL